MLKKMKWLLVSVLIVSLLLTSLVSCSTPEAEDDVCEHTFGEWVTSADIPVCSTGYKTRVCSLCNEEETEIIKPVAHNLIAGEVEEVEKDTIIARFRCEYCNVLIQKTVTSTADDDGDGITNMTEILMGTNPFASDTDKDGISDYREVSEYNTDPLLADSDEDGLTDLEELKTYNTLPLVADSDGDGVIDGKEVELKFDPLIANTNFDISYSPTFAAGEDTSVVPSIVASLTPEQINTFSIERDKSFSKDSLGYMGDAFKFSIDEETVEDSYVSLEIGFEYDSSKQSPNALPTIYALEENEHGITQMKPVETYVDDGKASALVDKFTTYVLVDRQVLESDLTWIDTHSIDRNFDDLEIVFVMDDSGSMSGNDYNNTRLTVARDLIDNLPAGTKIGVVAFTDDYNYRVLTGSRLITDKTVAKSYLSTNYFSSHGGTDMYDAIARSFDLFESSDPSTMRMVVVLTDGETSDTGYHSSVVNLANSLGINVYTVGLGSSSSSYFNNYLKPLANSTNGEFYYASAASNLASAFDAIGEKLSLTVDSDGDGLSDYYEENTVIFSGVNYNLDKDDPDTDGDGLLDGEEIKTTVIYSVDGTQMTIIGKVLSNPSLKDTDGDGINDRFDPDPMKK